MPRKKQSNLSPAELTESQVYDVFEFARQLTQSYSNIFTPDIVNARMKEISLNPIVGSKDEITKALSNPRDSEEQLRGYSDSFEYINMSYKKILNYYGNMLSFDYTYECTNAKSIDDLKSSRYLKDVEIVEDFLDHFKIKREFPNVIRSLLRNDAYYSVLRNDGEQFVLQELPQKYCKITGKWEYGYLFDFDMIWFIANPGVDINSYPKIFRQYYKRIMDEKSNGYLPSKAIRNRNGEWVYWVQTSPEDNIWCWKFGMDQVAQIPVFSPLFLDLINTDTIRQLQINKYIISAYKLIFAQLPMLKDNKSGNVKDMIAVSPEVAGKFASLVKQGMPKEIGFGFGPFESVNEFEFRTNENNIYYDHLKTTISNSGTQLQTVFSTEKANVEATRLSGAVDEYFMTYIYPYFNDFLNYHINKLTKKYKFNFTLKGTRLPYSEGVRFDRLLKLANVGFVLPQEIAASLHMEPKELQRQLMMANASGFANLLIPLITAYNQSSNNQGGRPQKTDGELGEAGQITRGAGSNLTRGGDI